MKQKRLLSLMGDIDEKFIEEAAPSPNEGRSLTLRYIGIAASVVFVLFISADLLKKQTESLNEYSVSSAAPQDIYENAADDGIQAEEYDAGEAAQAEEFAADEPMQAETNITDGNVNAKEFAADMTSNAKGFAADENVNTKESNAGKNEHANEFAADNGMQAKEYIAAENADAEEYNESEIAQVEESAPLQQFKANTDETAAAGISDGIRHKSTAQSSTVTADKAYEEGEVQAEDEERAAKKYQTDGGAVIIYGPNVPQEVLNGLEKYISEHNMDSEGFEYELSDINGSEYNFEQKCDINKPKNGKITLDKDGNVIYTKSLAQAGNE